MGRFRLVDVGVAAALAAAAVTVVGLVQAVGAAGGVASVFVPITPCRLLDTRVGSENVGARATPLGPGESATFAVWGTNGACTIPVSATGIATNTTAVNATAGSYLTVFPADAVPRPKASNLNFVAGSPPIPNQVTVGLSAAGAIAVFNNAGSVDVIIDIVGYYQPASLGPPGPKGDPGTNGATPAHVVWVATVASPGVFTSIVAALASINDNSVGNPYVIKIGPGRYTETGGIDLKDYVDLEGAGQDVTTITCACGSGTLPTTDGSSATLRANGTSGLQSEIRNLTVINTGPASGAGPNSQSTAIWTRNSTAGHISLRHVVVGASGGVQDYGVFNLSSDPTMSDIAISVNATGGTTAYGVFNDLSPSPMIDVTVTATGGSNSNTGVLNVSSSPTMTNVNASAMGGSNNYGVSNTNSSSSTMNGGTANASGGSVSNTGISISTSSPVINGVTVTAAAAGFAGPAKGIFSGGLSTTTLINVTVTASGTGGSNWGIDTAELSTTTIRDSDVSGQPNSVVTSSTASAPVRVAHTRLRTPAGSNIMCLGAYNDSFQLLTNVCGP